MSACCTCWSGAATRSRPGSRPPSLPLPFPPLSLARPWRSSPLPTTRFASVVVGSLHNNCRCCSMSWSRPAAGSQMAHQVHTSRRAVGIRVMVGDPLQYALQHLAALLFQGVQPYDMPGHMPPQISYRPGLRPVATSKSINDLDALRRYDFWSLNDPADPPESRHTSPQLGFDRAYRRYAGYSDHLDNRTDIARA